MKPHNAPLKVSDWKPSKDDGWFQLSGKVNETSAGDLLAKMLNWHEGRKSDEKGTFVVYLDSIGGNVGDALAIRGSMNILRRLGHKVIVVILGRASSCAGVIATGGDEVYMDGEAWFMIHAVKSSSEGLGEDLCAEGDYVKRLNEQTFRLLATPYWSSAEIAAEVKDKTVLWLSAKEAWERGLINGILNEPAIEIRVPANKE